MANASHLKYRGGVASSDGWKIKIAAWGTEEYLCVGVFILLKWMLFALGMLRSYWPARKAFHRLILLLLPFADAVVAAGNGFLRKF
jgi:hypothetical protein